MEGTFNKKRNSDQIVITFDGELISIWNDRVRNEDIGLRVGIALLEDKHQDTDKKRSTSRYGRTARRAVIVSRASSASEVDDILQNRRLPTSGRILNTQRVQLAIEANAALRGSRYDSPIRSFELLNLKK
ncbi:hypothetical protein F3Y22_tig00112738pilonHSYRG00698 [Hibiscus syriacus]|uniref:Uncharacterized protein n=1 Tax=Hibiscus syriacus TaxID=106335 RepID=A0A6A2WU02_HIBSY|nr:hypothetical protein F3Y22_tig00112738pilonHSYRG00698 [Hibiscus syriacus]